MRGTRLTVAAGRAAGIIGDMMRRFLGGLLALGLAVAVQAAGFKAGDKLEILWGGKWYPGAVIEAKDGKYKIRYDGFTAQWDEWVGPERVRPTAAAPAAPAASVPAAGAPVKAAAGGTWKVGDRLEALSFGWWYKATVTEAEAARVKVTYDGFNRSSDEWRNLDQVRPLTAGDTGRGPVKDAPAAKPAAAAATRPAGAKAGIEGAFLRVESFYSGGSLSLSNQGWFFTKDGRFAKSPAGGFSFKEFPAAGETGGTYWVAGGKITFAFADGSAPLTYDFEDKGDEVKWGGLGATRVEGLARGWRFDGEYEGGASIGGGALMSSNTLVFRRDGTFGRAAVASFKTTSDRSIVSGGATGADAGTYEFDGFSLTLRLAGGEVRKFTVFAFGDRDAAGRPEYLYRDGTMMRRQDPK